MTHDQWNTCCEPAAMLEFLRNTGRLSERKARLFGCACCRRVWELFPSEGSRANIELAEQQADYEYLPFDSTWFPTLRRAQGANAFDEWEAGWSTPDVNCPAWLPRANKASAEVLVDELDVRKVADTLADAVGWHRAASLLKLKDVTAWKAAVQAAALSEKRSQCELLRDLVCSFRCVSDMGIVNTEAILTLARSAYNDRQLPQGTLDPAKLAVLADALASFAGSELLGHLRGPGPHYRGCWALDCVLGKE